MKKKETKTILKKLILSIAVVIMIMQTLIPITSEANSIKKEILGAVFDIFCLPADGVIYLLQSTLMGIPDSVIVETEELSGGIDSTDAWLKGWQDYIVEDQQGSLLGMGQYVAVEFMAVGNKVWEGAKTGFRWVGELTGLWDIPEDEDEPIDEEVPFMFFSPEFIFSGMIPLFNIDFLSGEEANSLEFDTGDGTLAITGTDSGVILQPIVKNWYNTLRIFSLVALLSILIYAGIKIVFTSVSEQKAKYKEFIKDWVIALVLIAVLHYIMVAVVGISKDLSQMLNSNNKFSMVNFQIGFEGTLAKQVAIPKYEIELDATNLTSVVQVPSSEHIGMSRYMAGRGEWAYLIIYIVLVVYSVMFSWIYLKRVMYIAFLTIIAPLVAFSYPLDKMGDGSAQAFSFWIKEYVFNVFIQPLHLFIYMVIMTSAFELATANPIYSLVAMGSIFAFEKVVRQILGFNKAPSAPSLSSGVGTGMLLGNLFNQLKSGGNGNSSEGKDTDESSKIRTRKVDTAHKNRNPFTEGSIGGTTVNDNSTSEVTEEGDSSDIRNQLNQGTDGAAAATTGESGSPDSPNITGNGAAIQVIVNEDGTPVEPPELSAPGEFLKSDVPGLDPEGAWLSKPKVKDSNAESALEIEAPELSDPDEWLSKPKGKDSESKTEAPVETPEESTSGEDSDTLRVGTLIVDNLNANNAPGMQEGEAGGTSEGVESAVTEAAEASQEAAGEQAEESVEEVEDKSEDGDAKRKQENIAASDLKGRAKALRKQAAKRRFAALGKVLKQDLKRLKKPAGNALKKTARFAGKLPLAAMLATYGLAAGIATGDPSKAFGLTTGGAIAGGMLNDKINMGMVSGVKSRIEHTREDIETYQRARYGDLYTDLANLQADKAFMKDEEVDAFYREQFAWQPDEKAKDYRARIKDIKTQALEFRSRGITDDEVIAAAIALQQSDSENPAYQGENIYDIARFASQCPTNEEGMAAFEERLIKQYSKYISEEQAVQTVETIMDAISEMRK